MQAIKSSLEANYYYYPYFIVRKAEIKMDKRLTQNTTVEYCRDCYDLGAVPEL